MIALEALPRIIAGAANPDDCDDVAVRNHLVAALGIVLATCPSSEGGSIAAEPTADDGDRAPNPCAVGRQVTEACRDCLLS